MPQRRRRERRGGDGEERHRAEHEKGRQEPRRAAATPTISTGMVSDSTSTAISSPPRLKDTIRADHGERRHPGGEGRGDKR